MSFFYCFQPHLNINPDYIRCDAVLVYSTMLPMTTQSAVRQDVVLSPVTVLVTASSGAELQTEAEPRPALCRCVCVCVGLEHDEARV